MYDLRIEITASSLDISIFVSLQTKILTTNLLKAKNQFIKCYYQKAEETSVTLKICS